MSDLNFKPDSPEFVLFKRWWEQLDLDRGARARLRRAHTVEAIAFDTAYHELLRGLERLGSDADKRDAIAVLAALAARVERSEGDSIAQQMGTRPEGSKTSRISTLRFNRILRVDDDETGLLLDRLRRLLDQLGHEANLSDLAASVYNWSSDTRKRWARDYYRAAPSS